MKYGISFIKVNNDSIQQAIASNASKDHISYLKQVVAYSATTGFQYDEVSFDELSNILSNDYGFSPFRYKTVEEGAIYNTEKHVNPIGGIRGRYNINNSVTWVCLDVDDTTITDEEMHRILSNINHHIARTSNKSNPYKYRIILPLTKQATVTRELWKYFMKSISDTIGIKIDNLAASAVFYGYKNRKVYSTIGKRSLDPSTHLEMAHMRLAEIEDKRATVLSSTEASAQLQQPLSAFSFAYECDSGDGTTNMLGAIAKAKELGASREYIIDLLHSINNFWDNPMSKQRLNSTVMTAI